MSSGVVNESVYENAVIEVLKKAGWEYLYGPDIERADYRDPTMPDAVRSVVRKLNRDTPDDAINAALSGVNYVNNANF